MDINYYNFILTSILFVITDFSWITLNYDYYKTLCLKIQKEPFVVKIPPIIITYIALIIALYLYIKLLSYEFKNNNSNKNNINKYLISIFYGFLFGFTIYGTYSYTCCTYYKNYKYYDAFKDTLWGIVLFIISGLFYSYLSF